MARLEETVISRTILNAYHTRLLDAIESDVIVVGAGPSGMTGAFYLAQKGLKVTLLEKSLSPGGGIWGGGMAMNEAVVQEDALPLLNEIGIRVKSGQEGLYSIDAIELAAGLCLKVVQSGVVVLNLMTVEDISIHQGRAGGVVVNRTMISGTLPVDPITFSAQAIVDATGHDAVLVESLRKRGLLKHPAITKEYGEGPMDAEAGETFVVEKVAEIFPGLWVTGMSVCAAFGGPRMGPIFGGMLLSGKRMADLVFGLLSKSRMGNGKI